MCELLEVSRSGFYQWRAGRDRGPTPSQQRRAGLDAKVADFHKASDGVYGAPRILADLRADGERVSRKTVAASLRRQGLAGISPRRFAPATTVVDLDAAVPKDLVGRRFDTGVLNRVWTSDITYLRTGEGWLYSPSSTITPGCCPATGSASPKTPCAWPPHSNRRWPPAVSRPRSMSITARRSSMRGCYAPARNSGCAWCIRHPADPS
jgi:putative transposase